MPPKGKQGTKGQKQILQENADTLAFYRNMILCAACYYGVASYFFFKTLPTIDCIMIFLAAITYLGAYQFMSSMSSPKYGQNGTIIDEGCDLNIEGGIAEHVKDLIILTTGCVIFSTFSAYFWLFWLLAPARAFQMAWKYVLAPYFFQQSEEEQPEISEKKQRKMERKSMRYR